MTSTYEDSLRRWAFQCMTWCHEHNDSRPPRATGADRSTMERLHGDKLHGVRQQAKRSRRWSPVRQAIMDAAFADIEGGWQIDREARFREWAHECAEWCRSHNGRRLPRLAAREADPVERQHGQKLHSVRSALRGVGNMKWTPEREAVMDQAFHDLYEDWRGRAA